MARLFSSTDLKKHSQALTNLKSEVDDIFKGLEQRQRERFLFWEEVVGERISKVAVPVKNKKGVLFVKVQDAIWRFELTRGKDEIIKKINEHLKKNSIKDLVFI